MRDNNIIVNQPFVHSFRELFPNFCFIFFFWFQDTTPRRPKRHIVGGSAKEDSDCEPGNMSRSKRYKSHDSADEGSDYELGSTSRCKQYEADELHTPKSSETDQKASPSLRSSSRRHKPNKLYGSDWSTSTTTSKHLLNRQVTVRTHGTPKTPRSEVTTHTSITPVSKRVCVSPNVSEY